MSVHVPERQAIAGTGGRPPEAAEGGLGTTGTKQNPSTTRAPTAQQLEMDWFLACWWMAHDKPGASALFLVRELGLRYEAVWLLAQNCATP